MENKLFLLTIIINNGFSDNVMELARDLGARGGTIINGVGSASIDAEKLYGITINPEKEIVMIVISNGLKNKLLKAFYEKLGINTDAQGIAFTLPIDDVTSNLKNQYKSIKKTN